MGDPGRRRRGHEKRASFEERAVETPPFSKPPSPSPPFKRRELSAAGSILGVSVVSPFQSCSRLILLRGWYIGGSAATAEGSHRPFDYYFKAVWKRAFHMWE